MAEGDFVSTEEISTTQSLTYSFIIDDKDEVNSFTLNKVLGNSEQTEFVIGSLLDKQNTAFYITSATASYTGPNVHEINLQSTSSRFMDANGDLIYTLSFGLSSTEYQLIIKLKGNTNKDVAISFNRTANAKLFDSLAFTLALYGDGGKMADVNIGFYNLSITQTKQLEAYATTSVILDEYLSGNVNSNTVETADNIEKHITFQYDGNNSFYY